MRPCRLRSLVTTAVAASALCLTLPAIAHAHPFLRRASPAAADIITKAPRELRLRFSEPIELQFSRLVLTGADGEPVPLGELVRVPDSLGTIVAAIRRPLVAGEYRVEWQVAGDDAHVVRGVYSFVIVRAPPGIAGEPAGALPGPGGGIKHEMHHPADTPASAFDASDPLFVGVRWLMYLALVGIIGATVFQAAVLGPVARRRVTAGILPRAELTVLSAGVGQVAALLLVVTLPIRLAAQTVAMHAPGQAFRADMVGGVIAHTMWGWSWLAQLVLALTAVVLFRRARATPDWMPLRIVTLLLAFTPAFSGHAIAAERLVPLAVLSDGLHILGAAGWLGTLAVMLIVSITAALGPLEDHGALAAELVTAYSPVALASAALAGLTGVATALIHIGHVWDLWTTPYGRVLLLKLAILSVVIATGVYNWRRVLPSLGDRVGAVRVVRSASVEVLVAVLVLFVTAVLVSLPTPLAASGP